jgi:hypothetical protein
MNYWLFIIVVKITENTEKGTALQYLEDFDNDIDIEKC